MRYDRVPCLGDPMFSTLLGVLPADPDRPAAAGDEDAARLDDVAALAGVGLELISDGGDAAGPDADVAVVVARWQAAASVSAAAVKQVLLGPWSASRLDGGRPEAAAERLRPTILALAAAGCPLVEIAEPDAIAIADDPDAALAFAAAHRQLVDGSERVHASLCLTGGNFDGAAPATFFDLAYASYAFDLIAGPENWRLIVQAPTDRGIVCGALGLGPGADETREVLVWAAHYAASTNGRGLARVGLANAPIGPGFQPPSRVDVLRKLALVAEASRIAAVDSAEEMAGLLDTRAIGPRSARSARYAPARRRRS
ncbi:MAG TPA: hypothetical protein VHM48_14180 [Candidatus Limnocylindrales bacterium]|nr:hypothetical protein [Candidatus Limnocylindrales bacterium]